MNHHLTLRELPGVDTFIEHPIISELIEQYGRELTIYTVRALLDNARKKILNGEKEKKVKPWKGRADATDALVASVLAEAKMFSATRQMCWKSVTW